jgi:hypothetical protein
MHLTSHVYAEGIDPLAANAGEVMEHAIFR